MTTREGFLILGMHRSGTSSLAGCLVTLGFGAPRTLMAGNTDNVKGYWESLPIVGLNDAILASAGQSWRDWRPFPEAWYRTDVARDFRRRAGALLASEFPDGASLVLKDPRICRFARFWIEVLEDNGIAPRPILPVRHPLEVALSLQARDGMAIADGLLLWLRHTLDAEAATRGRRRAILAWDDLLMDWRGTLSGAADALGVVWPPFDLDAAAAVDRFLEQGLRHHRLAASDMALDAWGDWIGPAYHALAKPTLDAGDQATLDRTAAAFTAAGPTLAAVLANARAAAELADRQQAATEQARADAAERSATIDQVLTDLQARADRFARDNVLKATALAHMAQTIEALRLQQASLTERLDLMLQQHDAQADRLAGVDDLCADLERSQSWRFGRLLPSLRRRVAQIHGLANTRSG